MCFCDVLAKAIDRTDNKEWKKATIMKFYRVNDFNVEIFFSFASSMICWQKRQKKKSRKILFVCATRMKNYLFLAIVRTRKKYGRNRWKTRVKWTYFVWNNSNKMKEEKQNINRRWMAQNIRDDVDVVHFSMYIFLLRFLVLLFQFFNQMAPLIRRRRVVARRSFYVSLLAHKYVFAPNEEQLNNFFFFVFVFLFHLQNEKKNMQSNCHSDRLTKKEKWK